MSFIVKLRRYLRRASGAIFASSILLFVFSLLYISLSQRLTINERFQPRGTPYKNLENLEEKRKSLEREEFLHNASWTLPSSKSQIENADAIFHKFSIVDPNKALNSIQFLNENHEVLNAQLFGPLNSATIKYVVVVQVHNRIDYLKYLIGSLSRAKGIEQTLLVFTHDMISAPINAIIQSINFCRVIQLFFPYTFQLFPNVFPGESPEDCPSTANKEKAKGTNCLGEEFSDVGGHYRNPKLTQIKHHWWWKMNFLFDSVLPAYGLEEKLLILLEEDHLVAPDFIHVLNLMEKKRAKVFPDCELLCLGTYPKSFNTYGNNLDKLGAEFWFSSKFNMGLIFGKNLWEKIRSTNCSNFFCNYDDYNWDWTLMQLSVKCLPSKLRVIYAEAPRVIHIGDCGVHTHNCEVDKAVNVALNLFLQHNSSFFPAQLTLNQVGKRMLKPSKPNGGWSDPRDHRLCELNTHPTKVPSTEKLAKVRKIFEKQEEKEKEEEKNEEEEEGKEEEKEKNEEEEEEEGKQRNKEEESQKE
uniref:Alpha-1,6-mannosyl-glycoprotein 2-beta-N-acetylglucosaminyltransferase n=1 Tax=Meloidogyne incognita TaxID=6306 RepID=A0A914MTG9_MELIC